MNIYRKNAISAGVLFIIADLVGFLSFPFMAPVNAANYLVNVAKSGGFVATGAILLFMGGAAAIGIAISLYPVLRKHNEGLALGSFGFRTVEGLLDFVGVLSLLILITLSQQTLGILTVSGFHWAVNVVKLMAFSMGCMLYYVVFFRTKLIPRWLSGWGIAAAIMTMLSALLVVYGLIAPFSTAQVILNLPMLPQELVLAVWLIVKGFNPSAVAASPAKTAANELLSAA